MRKWTYLLVAAVCIVSLAFFPTSVPRDAVSAAEVGAHKLYLPMVRWPGKWFLPFLYFPEPIRFDDFQDEDPVWELMYIKDPKDGWFEHLNGVYAAHVRDNSAMLISSPGWRPRGDFKLEVDGSHEAPLKKSFNGLGLAFSGDDEWDGFYALMIAMGAAQNWWALVRFRDQGAYYLTNDGYRGGPGFMDDWDGTNHIMVTRIGDTIKSYCNGRALPNGDAVDDNYGPGRLVGLIVTSYEFDEGEMEFDNFQLTPLYPGDMDEDEVEDEMLEFYEFDTPPLDLH